MEYRGPKLRPSEVLDTSSVYHGDLLSSGSLSAHCLILEERYVKVIIRRHRLPTLARISLRNRINVLALQEKFHSHLSLPHRSGRR